MRIARVSAHLCAPHDRADAKTYLAVPPLALVAVPRLRNGKDAAAIALVVCAFRVKGKKAAVNLVPYHAGIDRAGCSIYIPPGHASQTCHCVSLLAHDSPHTRWCKG